MTTKTLGFTDKKLAKLADQMWQLTTSIDNSLTFTVKNVGDRAFPGGKITRIWMEQPSGLGSVNSQPTRDIPAVPEMAVGEEKTVFEWTTAPKLGGIATIRIELKADDNDTVQLKRFDSDTPTNPVVFLLAVGRLEDALIIDQLETISTKLDKLVTLRS